VPVRSGIITEKMKGDVGEDKLEIRRFMLAIHFA
jgi:hypothetical protein